MKASDGYHRSEEQQEAVSELVQALASTELLSRPLFSCPCFHRVAVTTLHREWRFKAGKQTGGQAHAKTLGVDAARRAFWCYRGCECANTARRGRRRVIRRQLSLGFFGERKHNLHVA